LGAPILVTLAVTDESGNSSSCVAQVTVVSTIEATLTPTKNQIICSGDVATLIANSGSYNYEWLLNGVTIFGANSASYEIGEAGDYQVVVSDANGCSDTSVITVVTVNTISASLSANGPTNWCGEDSVELIAGPAGLNYQWTMDGNQIPGATNVTYTSTETGDFGVIVFDNIGCVDVSSDIQVKENPLPVANAGSDTSITLGSSVVIGGNPTASGAYAPFTYFWLPFSDLNNALIANPTASPTATTNFAVQVRDINLCTAISSVTVSISCPTVTGLFTTNLGTTSVKTNWISVADASSYVVRYRIRGSVDPHETAYASSNSKWLISLTENTEYEYQIRANYANQGNSPWSELDYFTTPAQCDVPTNLNTTNISSSYAKLNWQVASSASRMYFAIERKTPELGCMESGIFKFKMGHRFINWDRI
jgi:hypothetical protein